MKGRKRGFFPEEPKPEGLGVSPSKWFYYLKKLFLRFLKERTSPREKTLGLSLGVFVGFVPLFGFQSLLLLLAAILVPRANRIALLLGFEATRLIPFPLYLLIEWKAGSFLFHIQIHGTEQGFRILEYWKLLPVILIGGLLIGLGAALLVFAVSLFLFDITRPLYGKREEKRPQDLAVHEIVRRGTGNSL